MRQKPLYIISIVAEILGIHPQTLRQYERLGLIVPSRTEGNTRLYSEEDLERLRYITVLTKEMGVNLAGVEIIMQMREQIDALNKQLNSIGEHIRLKYGEEIRLKNDTLRSCVTKIKIERE
ncbi:MAG: helix-turn-helix transcriptional regulator [Deferribacterales bacterium]|nr:helix-turn-helix transcriptional regulator [Deferribacterales bacterium]